MLMIDLHLFALNCNESFRIVVDEKEKRAKLCCLTLSILVFYVKCFIINLLGLPDGWFHHFWYLHNIGRHILCLHPDF